MIREFVQTVDDREWQSSLFSLLQSQTYNQCEVDLFELMCKVLDQNLFSQVDWARNTIFFKDLKVRCIIARQVELSNVALWLALNRLRLTESSRAHAWLISCIITIHGWRVKIRLCSPHDLLSCCITFIDKSFRFLNTSNLTYPKALS